MGITMFDSVDLGTVPRDAPAVAGYTSGHWPTYSEAARRWPHAHHLSIAVSARHDAECLDVEPGNAGPGDVPGWVRRQHSRGVKRPVVYASLSALNGIIAELQRNGIHRTEYRVWSAHYTFRQHICDRSCGLVMPADGTQWTDRSHGRNLDESLLRDDFFGAPPVPAPSMVSLTVHERGEVALYDRLNRHPHLHPVGLRKVQRRLVILRKTIWLAAHTEIKRGRQPASAWAFRNRAARYRILWDRTRGLG